MKKSVIMKKVTCFMLCIFLMFSLSGCRYSDVLEQIIYDHFRNEDIDEDPPFEPEENNYDNEEFSDDLNNLTDSEESERKDQEEKSKASPEGTQETTNSASPQVIYDEKSETPNGVAQTGTPSKVTNVSENTDHSVAPIQQDETGEGSEGGGTGTDGGTEGGTGDGGLNYQPNPNPDPDNPSHKQVVDDKGNEVEIPENVNAIAATGPAAMMSLILAGGKCLVASDANTVSSAQASGIFDSLSGTEALWESSGNVTISDANLNALIEKKPDVVIEASGSNGLTDAQVGQLQAAGISYLVLPPMTDVDSVKRAVTTMAQVLGDKTDSGGANATEMADKYCKWVDNARAAIQDATKEYQYQEETNEDGRHKILVDRTYTLFIDDWDSEAQYTLSNATNVELNGKGCAIVKIGNAESCLTISNFLGYANVINTSSKYGVKAKSEYFTPLVSQYMTMTINGPKTNYSAAKGDFMLQQERSSLGTPYFPHIIVANSAIKSAIENSKNEEHGLWKVYPHINDGSGTFNSDGFLDKQGHIVATQISGEYQIFVNPKGLVTDWTLGGCESILESLWAGWRFFDAITEEEMKNYITDFYSTFYGYSLSAGEVDNILKGA